MYFIYSLCLSPLLVNSGKMIKNVNFPACRNCIHHKPIDVYGEYTSSFSKCNNFGEKNIITNEINYDYVDICRSDELKCGKEGKYFVEEPNLKLKILKFNIKKNSPFFIWLTVFSFFAYIPYIINKVIK